MWQLLQWLQSQLLQFWESLQSQLLQSQLLQLQLLQLLQLLQPQDVPAMLPLQQRLQPQVLHTTPAAVKRIQPPGQVEVKGICVMQLQLEHAI